MNWFWFVYSTLGIACVYTVMAMGVVIVYRTNRVLPFHVGQIGALSAYVFTSIWTPASGVLPLVTAIAAVMAMSVAIGAFLHILIDRWGEPYGHFTGTVITIAVATFLAGLMSFIWTGEVRRAPLLTGNIAILNMSMPANIAIVIGIGTIAIVTLLLWMRRSRIGVDMQAISNNRRLAEFRGIPVGSRLITAWAVSTVLAALGGILMASLSVVSLEGSTVGINAIIAAIIGGMFSLPGALLGALLLATVENLVTVAYDPRYSQVVPVAVLVILLTIRPAGLSGHVEHISRV